MNDLELAVYRQPYNYPALDFYLISRNLEAGTISFGEAVVMKQPEEAVGEIHSPPPTFCLSKTMCQQLMEQLWTLGIRPTDQGSPGQIEAMKRHLEDMRTIAFKLLEPALHPLLINDSPAVIKDL